MNTETIRIVVADDHALFREGLRALFVTIPGLEVVGEAATGEEAIGLAGDLVPDIILMDINMPDVNGIDATRRILQSNAAIGVIMVTMLEDDTSLFSAMRAGALGYVLKGANHHELLQTIRAVAAGQVLFGAPIAARISQYFQGTVANLKATIPQDICPELTRREFEVLGLIAQGDNNRQIAASLFISEKTVRNHITSIFSKLQVADRAQAIVKARDAGLGS